MAGSWHQFIPLLILANIASFVGIVISSKYLFVHTKWNYPTLLVALHQFTGAVMMLLARICGWMKPPEAPNTVGLKLAVPGTASIFLLNLSLLYNSVSMYQMYKLLTVPMMCIFEYVWSKKRFTPRVISSLCVLVFGVGLLTVTEISFGIKGIICGLLAALAVAIQQPYAKILMHEHKLSPAHVLYLQCPLNALFLGLAIPTTEDICTLPKYPFGTEAIVLLTLSSLCYVTLGLSQMGIIGQTSAVTFQVVGLSKTVLTVLSGILTFKTEVTLKNVSGLSLAIGGIAWYSWLQVYEPAAKPEYPSSEKSENESELGESDDKVGLTQKKSENA